MHILKSTWKTLHVTSTCLICCSPSEISCEVTKIQFLKPNRITVSNFFTVNLRRSKIFDAVNLFDFRN